MLLQFFLYRFYISSGAFRLVCLIFASSLPTFTTPTIGLEELKNVTVQGRPDNVLFVTPSVTSEEPLISNASASLEYTEVFGKLINQASQPPDTFPEESLTIISTEPLLYDSVEDSTPEHSTREDFETVSPQDEEVLSFVLHKSESLSLT